MAEPVRAPGAGADPDRAATAPSTTPTTSAAPTYSERLWVPWWWWPFGALVAGLLAAEVHMGAPGILSWLPYVLLLPLAGAVVLRLGWLKVEVRDGELRVGAAHLPLDVVERTAVVPRTATRAALGRQLDPMAFVEHRSWAGTMVLVVLDDPTDPTPYWLVSTRHPERLAAAIDAGRPRG